MSSASGWHDYEIERVVKRNEKKLDAILKRLDDIETQLAIDRIKRAELDNASGMDVA